MIIKIKTWKTEDGRSWVGCGGPDGGKYYQSLQCAACLALQDQHNLKRKDGIVYSYEVPEDKESHNDDCIQKP